jgi:hypothetical protein
MNIQWIFDKCVEFHKKYNAFRLKFCELANTKHLILYLVTDARVHYSTEILNDLYRKSEKIEIIQWPMWILKLQLNAIFRKNIWYSDWIL